MFDTIAVSLILGALAEMRMNQARLNRKLVAISNDLKKHKIEDHAVPSFAYAIIIGFMYFSACFSFSGCSPIRVNVPHMPAFSETPSEPEGDTKSVPQTKAKIEKKPQAERAEDASYFWAKVGIAVNIAILVACSLAVVFAPTLSAQASKLAVWSLFLLGCSITVWVLAPAMIWIMYAVALLNVAMLALFIYNHIKKETVAK